MELLQIAVHKRREAEYVEEKIISEEKKRYTMAANRRGGSGRGGGRGLPTDEGRAGPATQNSEGVTSGVRARPYAGGARHGRD